MSRFLSGTVLYKEKIRDTVKRVAKEELGVLAEFKKILGYIEYPSEEKERGFGWTVSIAALCSIKSLDMKPNDDASEIKIFRKMPKNIIKEQREFLRSIGYFS